MKLVPNSQFAPAFDAANPHSAMQSARQVGSTGTVGAETSQSALQLSAAGVANPQSVLRSTVGSTNIGRRRYHSAPVGGRRCIKLALKWGSQVGSQKSARHNSALLALHSALQICSRRSSRLSKSAQQSLLKQLRSHRCKSAVGAASLHSTRQSTLPLGGRRCHSAPVGGPRYQSAVGAESGHGSAVGVATLQSTPQSALPFSIRRCSQRGNSAGGLHCSWSLKRPWPLRHCEPSPRCSSRKTGPPCSSTPHLCLSITYESNSYQATTDGHRSLICCQVRMTPLQLVPRLMLTRKIYYCPDRTAEKLI